MKKGIFSIPTFITAFVVVYATGTLCLTRE